MAYLQRCAVLLYLKGINKGNNNNMVTIIEDLEIVETVSGCCDMYADVNRQRCSHCGDTCAVIGLDDLDRSYEWNSFTEEWELI